MRTPGWLLIFAIRNKITLPRPVMKTLRIFFPLGAVVATASCFADTPVVVSSNATTAVAATNNAPSYAPAVLPGKGLAQHPFLYTGEWDYRGNRDQTIFVVRDGKVM